MKCVLRVDRKEKESSSFPDAPGQGIHSTRKANRPYRFILQSLGRSQATSRNDSLVDRRERDGVRVWRNELKEAEWQFSWTER